MEERVGGPNRVLGRVIAERRDTMGLTQRDVWTALGMTKNSYLRLEYDDRAITANILFAIADLLETTPGNLVDEVSLRLAGEGGQATENLRSALGYD